MTVIWNTVGLRRGWASPLALLYDVGVFFFRQTSVGASSRTRAYHVWVLTPATRRPTTAHQAVITLAFRYHTVQLVQDVALPRHEIDGSRCSV